MSGSPDKDVEAAATLLPSEPPPSTMSDIMDTVGFGRYQLGLGLLLGTLWMADGSELLCLSLCTQSLSADGILPTDKTLASHATGALGSCIFVGFLIGSLLAGPIADTYGRRRPILAFMGLLLLAGGVAPASMSYAMLVVTRTVLGVAIGGAGPAAFTLFAEFCPCLFDLLAIRAKIGFSILHVLRPQLVAKGLLIVIPVADDWEPKLALALCGSHGLRNGQVAVFY